jgi:hypothetical protein
MYMTSHTLTHIYRYMTSHTLTHIYMYMTSHTLTHIYMYMTSHIPGLGTDTLIKINGGIKLVLRQ